MTVVGGVFSHTLVVAVGESAATSGANAPGACLAAPPSPTAALIAYLRVRPCC